MSNVEGANFGGRVSVHSLLADALSEADGYVGAVVVVKRKGGTVAAGWCPPPGASELELIGLLEVAKDNLLQVMQDHAENDDDGE